MPGELTTVTYEKITDRLPLTLEDSRRLKKIISTKLFYVIVTYLTIAFTIWLGYYYALARSYRFNEDQVERTYRLAPFFFIAVFALLTGYFFKNYLRDIHPYIADLRSKHKEVIYFKADRYQTPFFHEFFLKTPLEKTKLIRIDRKTFDAIRPGSDAGIMYGKRSQYILGIMIDGREIPNT